VQLIGRVNRYLYERTGGEKYATVFFAVVCSDGMLRWINAGHCHPLLIRPDGEVRALKSTGVPLGMLDFAAFAVEEAKLEPHDKVLIYSDGLPEAQNPSGEFFEITRINDLMARSAALDSAALHADLMTEVSHFVEGAEPNDDVTAVLFEYAP